MSGLNKLQLLLVGIFFIGITWSVPLNLKNDLDGNLFHLLFIKSNLALGSWSNWNPHLHQGLPVMGDPINAIWYPLSSLVLLLPVEISVRLIFAISWVLSVVFAYFLFRKSGLLNNLSLWLGITYASGGYYLARIVAGHFEKVLSYPLIPFSLLTILILWKKQNKKNIIYVALSLFLLLASTDMYNFFYICVGYTVFMAYIFITNRKIITSFLLSIILGIGISAIRWLPMLEVLGTLFKIPDPYSGSQNIFSLVIQTVWPKPSMFSLFVPTNFGWWEKVGFVGPLFVVGLLLPWWWSKLKYKQGLIVALLFGLAAILISMPAFVLNPWHWVVKSIEPLTMFHVPTRVLAIFSLSMILMSGHILRFWKVWGVRFVKLNLIFIAVYWLTMFNFKMLPQINPVYDQLRQHMPDRLSSVMYSAYEYPVLERDWHESWQLFHTTHGTYIKNTPAADWTNFLVNGELYTNDLPEMLVWPNDAILPFSGEVVASASGVTLYKVNSEPKAISLQNSFSDNYYYLGAIISLGLLSYLVWIGKK